MKFVRLAAVMAALAVAACAQLGMAPVDTFNKKAAAGYTTVQAVAEGAAALQTQGKLNANDKANVVATARAAVEGLDLARTLHDASCPAGVAPTCTAPAADAKLQATLAVLTALQAYLATKGGS